MTRGQRRWIERIWVAGPVPLVNLPAATRCVLIGQGMIEPNDGKSWCLRNRDSIEPIKIKLTTLGEITYNEQVAFKERHPDRSI